ncbi:MAG: glucuronate isomerase [Rikenellaceae bacterium]
MAKFMDHNFMLESDAACELYHNYSAKCPIIDYHCHLIPQQIAENKNFENIAQVWLGGDHYKWRAMRGNGINEEYITGSKSDYEKFEKWAETVPYTMRNPLYHWTHLELSRIFGVEKILKPETAREIYEECTAKLQTPEFTPQGLMRGSNVETVCTTDDPIDTLEYHKQIAENPFGTKVLPTWRADKAMAIANPTAYNSYLSSLEAASNTSISSYSDLLAALENRHAFFAEMGCKLSDHGLETFYADPYTDNEVKTIFDKVRAGGEVTAEELGKFRAALLFDLAVMDHKRGWTQQFHIGAIRDNNTRMFRRLGPDTGYDAIADFSCAQAGHRLFGRLDEAGALTKTILYNLNPCDNEVLATMAYTFQDGSVAGKMQYGSAWWFLDTEVGMVNQMNALSSLGLLSRFVGMLTDSRSFLSYPRHEYFRRILCNLIGKDLESGKIPSSEMESVGRMVSDVSYGNAKRFFEF